MQSSFFCGIYCTWQGTRIKQNGINYSVIVLDSVKGVFQSVIELHIANESNKKPAAKASASYVEELGKNIIKVSNIEMEVGNVAAENNVETEVGDTNEDRLNLKQVEGMSWQIWSYSCCTKKPQFSGNQFI